MKSASSPVSASEVDTFIQCERLWAFKYRWDQGPKTRRRAYFEVGKKFDRIVEDYWKFGIVPIGPDPLNELFMKLIPVIPGPGLHRHLQLQDRWKYNGLPVLTIPDYVGQPGFIGDLKTTKDIKAYGLLTKEQKLTNTQTVMYSFRYLPDGGVFDHWYAQKHRAIELAYEDKTLDPALIELYRTSNGEQGKQKSTALMAPKALGTPIELTRGEIVHAFETHVLPPSERVYQLRNKHARIDPMTMPEAPETENPYDRACAKYGGCEYRDVCFPKAKDFGAANLHRDSTEVKLVFGGDAVKFKIQKPEQIQVESATEAQVEAPKSTGRFAPKAKTVTDVPAAFEAPPLKVESFVEKLQAEETSLTSNDIETVKAFVVVEQEPMNALEAQALENAMHEQEEPTIPVDSLITKEMVVEAIEKSLPEGCCRTVMIGGVEYPVMSQEFLAKEAHDARALRLGRAVLEILDVLTSK